MTSNPHPSPAAIPPRTSSTNQTGTPTNSTPTSPITSSTTTAASATATAAITTATTAAAATSRHRSTSSTASGDWFSQRAPPPPPQYSSSPNPHAHMLHRRFPSSSTTTVTYPTPVIASQPSSVLDDMQKPSTPPDPARYETADLDFTTYRKTWTEDKDRIVRGPFDYLNDKPGKDFRTKLIAAFDAWLEVPKQSLEVITRLVGMLHTASLLVDDVEDGSNLRRGLPVAHSIFGVPQTINSANYIYFVALQELQKLSNPKAIQIFTEELVNLHRGQGMDLFWRDSMTCPTEEDYLEMVGNKTGGLFRLGIKLMQAESPHDIDCVPLVNIIGLIFQIRDDYLNLSSATYTTNKGMCEDLTEGKFSFPIIHSIRADPTNMQLLNILGQKTNDADVKKYAVAYMEGTGSFDYTRNVLTVLVERARKLADETDAGRGRAGGIHRILDTVAS